MFGVDRWGFVRVAVVSWGALVLVAGCASTVDPKTVVQPGMDQAGTVPFDGHLEKSGDGWTLSYVEDGNLAIGPLGPGTIPDELEGVLADSPSIQGKAGWYPADDALIQALAEDRADWNDFATVMESVKTRQADSVANYNQRLADVVAEYHELHRVAAKTELPGMPDWRDQAREVASEQADTLAKRLRSELKIRWVDETDHGLLEQVSPDPAEAPVRIKAEYEGGFPDFTAPDSPDEILDWLPSASLAELERRAEEARPRIENLAEHYAAVRTKNKRKLDSFSEAYKPGDFAVAIERASEDPTGYQATVEPPEVEFGKDELSLAGPVEVKVQSLNLGAWFRLRGIMPPGATLRTGPSEDAGAIRKVSGPEVGYPVETRGDWTRLFGENNDPLGWVPADRVAGPQKVIEAQVQRALGDD